MNKAEVCRVPVEDTPMMAISSTECFSRIAAVRSLGGRPDETVRRELERLLDSEEDPTVIKAVEELLRV